MSIREDILLYLLFWQRMEHSEQKAAEASEEKEITDRF